MKGWIIYKKNAAELSDYDHGVMRLLAAAQKINIELKVFRPDEFEIVIGINPKLFHNDQPIDLPQFILPRMGADTSYQALTLIRHIESLGIPSFNNSTSIDFVRDKMLAMQRLVSHGLPTPKTMLLKFPFSLELVKRELGFPLVIKTLAGMRGVGVFLCETETVFSDLMGLLSIHHNQKQLIAQEFIANSYGRDLRVFVIDGNVVGCMQRLATSSFKANYSLGGKVEPFPVTDEIKQLSIDCAQLFQLDIAGIDLLFGEEGFLICEANSSPGFKGMEQTTDVDIADAILQLVKRRI